MKVVKSINDITGTLCVDIISNGEGQFSYKCFRRDPEDNSGWYSYGAESYFLYSTCQEAQKAAYKVVSWSNKE